MATRKAFNAQGLRTVLALLLVAAVLGGACLFYLGLNKVSDFSVEVNHSLKDADASALKVKQLQVLKGQLSQSEVLIGKADALFATPETYQGQASTDLRNYAKQVGLTITAINFDDPATTGTYAANVTFGGSVGYPQLVQFLQLVEGNLPKMQVTDLSLKHKPGGTTNDIEVDAMKINITVR